MHIFLFYYDLILQILFFCFGDGMLFCLQSTVEISQKWTEVRIFIFGAQMNKKVINEKQILYLFNLEMLCMMKIFFA